MLDAVPAQPEPPLPLFIPSDPTADPQEIREYQKAGWDGDGGGVDDETDTLRREAAEDEYGEYNSDPTARHWTTGHHAGPGLIKDWNVGSWIGFIVLGPVLTSKRDVVGAPASTGPLTRTAACPAATAASDAT